MMVEEKSADLSSINIDYTVFSTPNGNLEETKQFQNSEKNSPEANSSMLTDGKKKEDDSVTKGRLEELEIIDYEELELDSESVITKPILSKNSDSEWVNDTKKSKSNRSYTKKKRSSYPSRKHHEYACIPTEGMTTFQREELSPNDNERSDTEYIKPFVSRYPDEDSSSSRSPRSSDCNQEEMSSLLSSPTSFTKIHKYPRKLKIENERLQAEISRLRKLVVCRATSYFSEKKNSIDNGDSSSENCNGSERQMQLAKEALIVLKSDKRRLKIEKHELQIQLKDLFLLLEDREKELRDFMRNFSARSRSDNNSMQQLTTEREERERERWSLLKHARDEAERSLSLAAQLNKKEMQLQITQNQLREARKLLLSSGNLSDQESLKSLPRYEPNGGSSTPGSGGHHPSSYATHSITIDNDSCMSDAEIRKSSDQEARSTISSVNLSDSIMGNKSAISFDEKDALLECVSSVSSLPPQKYQSTKDSQPTLSPQEIDNYSRAFDSIILSRSVEQLSSPIEPEIVNSHQKQSQTKIGNRGGTWGSISRVFARSKNRHKVNCNHDPNDYVFDSSRSWSPLSEEIYVEKLKWLKEASEMPMERWRAPTVLAWIEVTLGMPQYGAKCVDHMKNGKIAPVHGQMLLELTDSELENIFGISHLMHRKKLRLAIEQHRHRSSVKYSGINQLGHTWVSSEWLSDIGLPQYSENFTSNMVDARMLEHLTKKELEKYMGVTKKFHQASIVHGIYLLRIMKYDRQSLAMRRRQCEKNDSDPLVWTNQRFIRWAEGIDLGDYADNLRESGVHGALVILEPSFNGDTMATALGVPITKNILRRHLTTELEALIFPARYVIFCEELTPASRSSRTVTHTEEDN